MVILRRFIEKFVKKQEIKGVNTYTSAILANYLFIAAFLTALFSRIAMIGGTLLINSNLFPERYKSGLIDAWAINWSQWDAGWYAGIATYGYYRGGVMEMNLAFFPAYPLMMKYLQELTNWPISITGIIISNIAFLIATILLFLIVKRLFSATTGYLTVLVISFYPLSYIFSGVMTESIFIMLFLFAIFFAQRKMWIWCGLSLAALSGTRNIGILATIPVALIWYDQLNLQLRLTATSLREHLFKIRDSIVENPKILLTFALAPAGLLAYMYYSNEIFGDPLAFVKAVKYWGRQVEGNPIENMINSVRNFAPSELKYHIFNVGFLTITFLSFLYGAIILKVKPWLLSVYIFLLLPLASGLLMSFPRYTTVIFPIYIIAALFIQKTKFAGLLFIFIIVFALSFLSMLYTIGSIYTV